MRAKVSTPKHVQAPNARPIQGRYLSVVFWQCQQLHETSTKLMQDLIQKLFRRLGNVADWRKQRQ
jgi:hypothetical protein